ncbi:MAG: hypothetical protein Q8R87_03985, partial [Anaerolineaceae bacterium]|nr:hypothetical protein [Anaerolineaceae bacterium]
MNSKMNMLLKSLISIVVILSFLSTTINVYAEDEQPQAVDSATVTQPPADPPVVSTDSVAIITVPDVASSTPEPVVQTDIAATDQDIQSVQSSTDVPIAEGQPINASVEPLSSPEPNGQVTILPATVLEMIDALPADTDLVVQDVAGNTLPLASIAAESVIASGDPVWCPAGSKPGDSGCTATFTHFNGVDGLISALAADATKTGEGTIYVAYDYAATVANGDKTDIVFDHLILGNLTSLVFQGGWDFSTNSVNSTSTFDLGTGGLQFLNWGNSLTLNNITVSNSKGGLVIDETTGDSTANVTLNHVDQAASGDYATLNPGTKINTSGNVTINYSTFSGVYEGLLVRSEGNIILNNVGGGSNYGDSARLDNSSGTGDVKMTDTTFSGSSNGNLVVLSKGDISFNNVTASGSGGPGINAYLNNTYGTGSVFMTGTNVFGRAGGDGLVVYSNGDITLNNVDSSRGGGIGAYLDNSTGTGNVILTGTNDFSRGVGGCLTVMSNGDISLSNILADRAGGTGTLLDNTGGTGSVTLTGTNNFDSGNTGLRILSNGDINMNNIS